MAENVITYEVMSDEKIRCPKCHSVNMNHDKVEVFNRKEDEECVFYSSVSQEGLVSRHDNPEDSKNNPSARRHALKIWFSCEECDFRAALNIVQHKGSTLLYWDEEKK
jgi:ribosomal protein L37AE/L43A